MKQDSPSPSQQVPETDAVYERTRASTTRQKSSGDPENPGDVRETPLPAGGSIEGDMTTEEPTGSDQAPQGATQPKNKRHPRPDGVGGSDPKSSVDRTGASKGHVASDGTVNTGF